MTLRRSGTAVPAGLLDAGLASFATFAIGLYATRFLNPDTLGIYALFFAAFVFASAIPNQLLYTPVEIRSLAYPRDHRLAFLPQSMRLGLLPSTFALLALVVAATAASPEATSRTVAAFLVPTALATIVSPLQNHVRRLLHQAARDWAAAAVSGVQVVTAGIVLLAFHQSSVPRPWAPFSALAAANMASLAFGTVIARSHADVERLRYTTLRRTSLWLLTRGIAESGSTFAASAIIANLAGARVLGYAEAARIVAQPLFVMFIGMSAALGPRAMEAAVARDRPTAHRITLHFNALVVTAGIAYLALVGWPWAANPVRMVIPVAFVVPGLAAASILAELSRSVSAVHTEQLLASGQEASLARFEIGAGVARLLTAPAAPLLRSFVVPAGLLVQNLYRLFGMTRTLRQYYAAAPGSSDK